MHDLWDGAMLNNVILPGPMVATSYPLLRLNWNGSHYSPFSVLLLRWIFVIGCFPCLKIAATPGISPFPNR